jgi:hypothetical protein
MQAVFACTVNDTVSQRAMVEDGAVGHQKCSNITTRVAQGSAPGEKHHQSVNQHRQQKRQQRAFGDR